MKSSDPFFQEPETQCSNLQYWAREIKELADYRCVVCGDSGNGENGSLESHHIIPQSVDDSLALRLDNGICLCKKCHSMIHIDSVFTDYLRDFALRYRERRKVFEIHFSKKDYEAIKAAADSVGKTVNGYIKDAVGEAVLRDTGKVIFQKRDRTKKEPVKGSDKADDPLAQEMAELLCEAEDIENHVEKKESMLREGEELLYVIPDEVMKQLEADNASSRSKEN